MLRIAFFFLSFSSLLFSQWAFSESYIKQRLEKEREAYEDGFMLIPHKANYVLPLTYMHRADDAINPHGDFDLQHTEIKFQISLKVLTISRPLLKDNGYLFFAYTNTSTWQAYNRSKSSPFRDSNHSPEMFMQFTTPWEWRGITIPQIIPGFIHQSNGQSGLRSRAWNRIYVNTVFSYKDWYLSFKPWYRIPVRKKRYPLDAKGDDNPDILNYYGHFEVNLFHEFGNHHFRVMLRNNFKQSNRGAIEVNYTYPINTHLKGYIQLYHGYGEMLIDYDQRNTRIGFGFMLNNWM